LANGRSLRQTQSQRNPKPCPEKSALSLILFPSDLGPPADGRQEIVQSRHVLQDLRAKGAMFVKKLDENSGQRRERSSGKV